MSKISKIRGIVEEAPTVIIYVFHRDLTKELGKELKKMKKLLKTMPKKKIKNVIIISICITKVVGQEASPRCDF